MQPNYGYAQGPGYPMSNQPQYPQHGYNPQPPPGAPLYGSPPQYTGAPGYAPPAAGPGYPDAPPPQGQAGYPPQNSYPPQGSYPPQNSFPPQGAQPYPQAPPLQAPPLQAPPQQVPPPQAAPGPPSYQPNPSSPPAPTEPAPGPAPKADATAADPTKPFDGTAWLVERGFTLDDIQAAKAEHAIKQPNFCASGQEIRDEMGGHGMFMFFEFAKYCAVLMIVLALLQIINYAAFVAREQPDYASTVTKTLGGDNSTFWYTDFFISAYKKDDESMWLGINVVCFVIALVAAPAYYLYVRLRWAAEETATSGTQPAGQVTGARVVADDHIVRFNADGTIDVSSHYRSFGDLFLRRAASFVVFAILLGIQCLASGYLTREQETRTDLVIPLIITIVLSGLNATYQFLSTFLTEMEKHMTMSAVTRWETMKLFVFKMCNLIFVYAFKSYTSMTQCVYDIVGQQFMMILLIDLLMLPVMAFVGVVWNRQHQLFARLTSSINGDARHMPQFVVTGEYLKIVYRLFVVMSAMTVFPLAGCVGVLIMAVDFWFAKFRLFKLCGRPVTIVSSQRAVLAVGLVISALAALLMPYAGGAWILSGWTKRRLTGDEVAKCSIPE